MSGYKRDIVMRLVPKNGGETVYWFEDQLTDAAGHTRCTVRYPETMTMREDINRNLRPVFFGVRPEVEIETQIATMADQAFLAGIEDALLRPREYQVFLSLDGGVVEREVVMAAGSMPDPLRGKTYVGARFNLSLRCKALIDRKPVMTTDPTTGMEMVQDGGLETWASNSWEITGASTMTQETTIIHGGASSAKITRTDALTADFRPVAGAVFGLRSGCWYRYQCYVRGSIALTDAFRLRISNFTRDREVASNGKTWGASGTNFNLSSVTTSFALKDGYFRRDTLDVSGTDRYRPRHLGVWTTSESVYYDDCSIYGPVLRPGYSTW